MTTLSKLFISSAIGFMAWSVQSQSCDCTVAEVKNNSVTPCNIIVGEIRTVNSVSSLKDAFNQANASGGNMTILIEDGTYHVASTTSYPYITASDLVIRSASGNRNNVIIHGDGMKDVSPNTEDGLHIAGNNVIIADLTIRNVGNHGIQVSGHNLYVHNVRIQDTYQQMLKGATSEESIDSATIQCSLFEYTAGTGPNFYIGGLDIHKGFHWTVRDNVFRNISSPSGSVAEHAIHFWNNAINPTIERNQIINCDRGIGLGLGNSAAHAGIIKNNMIYNDGSGAFNDVGIGLESSTGILVLNNTIYVNYQNAIEYRFAETFGVNIINNLTNKPITSRDGGMAWVANNVTNAQPDWFINLNEGDLHLTSPISTVVDQGSAVENVEDDIDRTPRPQSVWFDIGADELLSTSIVDLFFQTNIALSPNPSDGNFRVRLEDRAECTEAFNVEIFNLTGKKIFEKKCEEQNCACDINPLLNTVGIYIIKVSVKGKSYFNKLIFQ